MELPDEIRVPLHSLQADIKYLFGRVAADGSTATAMAESVLERLSQIEVALKASAPSPSAGGDLSSAGDHSQSSSPDHTGTATEDEAQRGLNDTWPGDPYP
jgi:hypothetical protein